jgi:DNA-binding LacI/PurR family transcriptional regulator
VLEHLIHEHGRRRIAFIRGPEGNEDSFVRESAYRQVLETHEIPFDAALLLDNGFTEQGGEAAVQRLLANQVVCDAIFAGDDEAAAGVLLALRRAGKRVPEEIAVVGFDDVPLSRHLNPPLTTVRAPIETASYLAARQLVRLIRNDDANPITVLPVELVVRQSCGCP